MSENKQFEEESSAPDHSTLHDDDEEEGDWGPYEEVDETTTQEDTEPESKQVERQYRYCTECFNDIHVDAIVCVSCLTKQNEMWKGWVENGKEVSHARLRHQHEIHDILQHHKAGDYDVALAEQLLNEALVDSVLCDTKLNPVGVLVRVRLVLVPVAPRPIRHLGVSSIGNIRRSLTFQYASETSLTSFLLLSKDLQTYKRLESYVHEFFRGERDYERTMIDTNTATRGKSTVSQRVGKNEPRLGSVQLDPMFSHASS